MQITKLPKSYDIIGDILIFEVKEKLNSKQEKQIANELLKQHNNVKVVAKRSSIHEGKYRLRKIKILAGEKRKETIHKESGLNFKLDVEKCYFSERSSNERLRIANLVKKDEIVLVMFSGIAPLPLVISKYSKAKEIYGIELNPLAHKYALENVRINKRTNISLYKGDVKKVLPKLKIKFDRIVMPLPRTAEKYLDLALKYLKPKGTIHLYKFEHEDNFNDLIKKYSKFKVNLVKAGVFGPQIFRVCLDLKK
ncbi:MAG: class I SAM-dependent methyltransferase family protein [Candidatus Nanoarchaeia archaeon]|nr:class I SAM-dependent methyltransferase family protein [Candidatus Nanoarchaeia archaeon]MDD5587791.1 class I SAM-dependent methyltransferase family protein [Candidatus Nanoarchaeia archaeon]